MIDLNELERLRQAAKNSFGDFEITSGKPEIVAYIKAMIGAQCPILAEIRAGRKLAPMLEEARSAINSLNNDDLGWTETEDSDIPNKEILIKRIDEALTAFKESQ